MGDQLLKANDENPADYTPDQPQVDDVEQRLTLALELANIENEAMMKGQAVSATPYAPVAHTAIHVEFTKSPPFQELPSNDPRIQIFTDHITGELFAQTDRGQAGAAPSNGEIPRAVPTTRASAGGNRTIREIFPDKVQGGEMQKRQAPAS